MRIFRKRNGFSAMRSILKTMFAETPLVMNLENSGYMHILLDGKKTLEQRFAEIDAQEVRRAMEESRKAGNTMLPQIKKIIKLPRLPELLVSLLQSKAS